MRNGEVDGKVLKGRPKLLKGRSKLLKGRPKVLKGRSKVLKGRPNLLKGRPKLLKGRSKLLKGRCKEGTSEEVVAEHPKDRHPKKTGEVGAVKAVVRFRRKREEGGVRLQ